MSLKRRLAVCVAVVAAALGGSAGTALACHGGHNVVTARLMLGFNHHQHAFVHRSFVGGTITSYLGLTQEQLKADLKSGQTLAQIADSISGKSSAGLVAAIVAPWQAKLDAAVSAGKLSSSTESSILADVNTKVTAFVNGQWHWWWHDRDHR